jgi:16S rRNA (guanine527-N7)-methyltransferase
MLENQLRKFVEEKGISLESEVVDRIDRFYGMVLKENQSQNLTRLTSPEDFFYGHVVDVLELIQTGYLSYPALDIGSGVGIPGLLTASLEEGKWILTDSEGRKANYLQEASLYLGLRESVEVFSGRAEKFLEDHSVQTVIARAVSSVERIYGWIRRCSTWNKLILLKGPAWTMEWESFQLSRFGRELKIDREHLYYTGPERKTRRIIQLSRVPLGTTER